jgi:hypothetical protein
MLLYDTLSALLVLGVLAFEAGGEPPRGTHLVAAFAYLNAAVAIVLTGAFTGLSVWVAVLGALTFLVLVVIRLVRYKQPPRFRRR